MSSKEVSETEAFLDSLRGVEGESALLRVLHRLRQRNNILLAVAVALVSPMMWLFFHFPNEEFVPIMVACLLVLSGTSKLPDAYNTLAAEMAQFRGRSEVSTSESVAFNWLARRNEKRLLPDLLQLLEENSTLNPQQLARRLNRLEPGDGIYLTSQNLAFLRHIVSRRLSQAARTRYGTDLTAAAIHALGIAGDASARRLLSRLVESPDPLHAPFRTAAFEALGRIDDLTAWRNELKPVQPASRRRNPAPSTRT